MPASNAPKAPEPASDTLVPESTGPNGLGAKAEAPAGVNDVVPSLVPDGAREEAPASEVAVPKRAASDADRAVPPDRDGAVPRV